MASHGRWAARLEHLTRDELGELVVWTRERERTPHKALVAIIAKRCVDDDEMAQKADELLADVCPVPEWAVSGVLVAPDLLPSLLDSLPLKGHLASVCSAWRDGWLQVARQRRLLHPVPCVQPVGLQAFGVRSIEAAGDRVTLLL